MVPGDRIRVVKLLVSAEHIQVGTGVAGVHVGMLATVVSTRPLEDGGWVEVRLDRAGELLAFHVSEIVLEE